MKRVLGFGRRAVMIIVLMNGLAAGSAEAAIISHFGSIGVQGLLTNPYATPAEGEIVSTFNGGVSGEGLTNTTRWRVTEDEVMLAFNFDLAAESTLPGTFESQLNFFDFTIDEAATYRLDGFFSLDSGEATRLIFNAFFSGPPLVQDDRIPFPYLVRTSYYSEFQFSGPAATSQWDLTLGQAVPGVAFPQIEGALTNYLIPGRYTPNVVATATLLPPGGASASGLFRISAVPEPSTALLLALGLAGLTRRRRMNGVA